MATIENPVNRTVVLASADPALRQRLHTSLSGLRWQVREAHGGAEALQQLEEQPTEALLLDDWLPDLEVLEFLEQIIALYPEMDLLRIDGDPVMGCTRSPRRHELLHALREASGAMLRQRMPVETVSEVVTQDVGRAEKDNSALEEDRRVNERIPLPSFLATRGIEEMVGDSPVMRELAHMIRLVAPRGATVLIEGETGTGKEVVARAIHRLSLRADKPFVVLNCAAIPEALLEAELFGHTRGAFTGAVQSRIGRIEAANHGTLFLDEIGEMPLGLQAKLLRFLDGGELQRVGDNGITHVDVRVIAATHQQLEKRAAEGTFRLDLYHRLAVFPLAVPALRERIDDIALLAEHFLEVLGKTSPRKRLSSVAYNKLCMHDWPGNVRELAHVLERACIFAEDYPELQADDIRVRREVRR